MHPRVAELLAYIDEQRAGLEAAVAGVPPELRAVRPEADGWSVAEVLDHLATVESGVARLVERRLGRAREAGLGPETEDSSVLRSLDDVLDGGIADSPLPREAPEIVRPRPDADAAAALASLAGSRAALRATLAAGDGLALGRVTAPHVTLGELSLYQWVLFVGQHERRHARQVRAIGERLAAGVVPLAPPPA
jgi:hypothetical protein